jgi:hypothetical protein
MATEATITLREVFITCGRLNRKSDNAQTLSHRRLCNHVLERHDRRRDRRHARIPQAGSGSRLFRKGTGPCGGRGAWSHVARGPANSPKRRRLVLTRRVKALAPDPNNTNARLWNPAGASLEAACAAVGCRAGRVAVLGGPEAYSHFLEIGYDSFYLSCADKVRLRGGLPVFPQGPLGRSPEKVLAGAGLKAGKSQRLGNDVSLVEWRRRD